MWLFVMFRNITSWHAFLDIPFEFLNVLFHIIRFSSTWKKKVMSEREKTLLTQEIVNTRRRAKPGILFAVIKKDSVDLTGLLEIFRVTVRC